MEETLIGDQMMNFYMNDREQIVVDVKTLEQCDEVIASGIPAIIELAEKKKASILLCNQRYDKYVEWWNKTVVPSLGISDMSEKDVFKWDLVKQEIRMWMSIDKPVKESEVDWLCGRRGFDARNRTVLIDALELLGLKYDGSGSVDESNTYSPEKCC